MSLLDLFNQKDKSVKTKEDPKPVLANDLTLTEDELMDLTVEERLVESGFHLFKGRYEKALPTYDFIIDHVCCFFSCGRWEEKGNEVGKVSNRLSFVVSLFFFFFFFFL